MRSKTEIFGDDVLHFFDIRKIERTKLTFNSKDRTGAPILSEYPQPPNLPVKSASTAGETVPITDTDRGDANSRRKINDRRDFYWLDTATRFFSGGYVAAHTV